MAGYQINPDSDLDKKMRTVQFFNLYFDKFRYIFLSNLLFIIFDVLALAYVFLIYSIFHEVNVLAFSSAMIVLNVGMAGITNVCRYIYTKKEFTLIGAFFGGIKENGLKFLLHGVVFWFVFSVSYSSILLYYNGTKTNSLFWVPLVITALISFLALFSSYYLNLMTATMELGLKDIYRNCLLFSFGELKNNLFATFALLIFAAVLFSVAVIINNLAVIIMVCGIIAVLIAPSTIQYILTFYIYDGMVNILDESIKREKLSSEKPEDKPNVNIGDEEAEELSRIVHESSLPSASESDDEYIFYNGKMVKRSLLNTMDDMND